MPTNSTTEPPDDFMTLTEFVIRGEWVYGDEGKRARVIVYKNANAPVFDTHGDQGDKDMTREWRVGDLQDAISRACTEWFKTPGGYTAFEKSTGRFGFNVGDLANHLADETLIHCLEEQGVRGLRIVVWDDAPDTEVWDFSYELGEEPDEVPE